MIRLVAVQIRIKCTVVQFAIFGVWWFPQPLVVQCILAYARGRQGFSELQRCERQPV
jgi:hypothetical protein